MEILDQQNGDEIQEEYSENIQQDNAAQNEGENVAEDEEEEEEDDTPSISIKIQNVVSTVNLGCRVELVNILFTKL